MKTIEFSNEYWNDTESKVEFIAANTVKKGLLITAVKVYIILHNKLLLTCVKRGWDLPGGHIEKGESPQEALTREVMEETGGVIGEFFMLGYLKITKMKKNSTNKQYPKRSCILIYVSKNIKFQPYFDLSRFEAFESKFIHINQIHIYHHYWTKMKKQILNLALNRVNINFTGLRK